MKQLVLGKAKFAIYFMIFSGISFLPLSTNWSIITKVMRYFAFYTIVKISFPLRLRSPTAFCWAGWDCQ